MTVTNPRLTKAKQVWVTLPIIVEPSADPNGDPGEEKEWYFAHFELYQLSECEGYGATPEAAVTALIEDATGSSYDPETARLSKEAISWLG